MFKTKIGSNVFGYLLGNRAADYYAVFGSKQGNNLMISFEEALFLIEKEASLAPVFKVRISEALGCVSAEEIKSPISLPSFRNSAMDGYMVRSHDLAAASPQNPIGLDCLQTVYAGDNGAIEIQNQPFTVGVMTGAPVNAEFDAVIPLEDVERIGDVVLFKAAPKKNANIRECGEDVSLGQSLTRPGDILTAERLMLLAATGVELAAVYQLPSLYLFNTGDELMEQTGEGAKKIHNSNGPFLQAAAKRAGYKFHPYRTVGDQADALAKMISAIKGPGVIISTGAVSKGAHDFIPETLEKLGARIVFHRVNARPGKPVLFARLADGKYYFGLAGNPAATAAGFRFYVTRLMRAMQGLPREKPIMAKLTETVRKKDNFRQFLKAKVSFDDQGKALATIVEGQESFMVASLANGNAFADMKEDRAVAEAGEMIPVYPYHNLAFQQLS